MQTANIVDLDQNTIQLLFGVVYVLLAALIATSFLGNIMILTAVVVLMLLVNGVPNMIMGIKNMWGKRND